MPLWAEHLMTSTKDMCTFKYYKLEIRSLNVVNNAESVMGDIMRMR